MTRLMDNNNKLSVLVIIPLCKGSGLPGLLWVAEKSDPVKRWQKECNFNMHIVIMHLPHYTM
jgi:hypothetical protein